MFQLLSPTDARLTKLVPRVQKSGDEDVPAISFYLKLEGVDNAVLDMLSTTIRATAYSRVEGQETLPGVPESMPILRSKDLRHWSPEELRYEGWSVTIAHGIDDGSAIRSGACKVDNFACDFHDGGRCDLEFRVSTADIDSDGVGILWAQQKRVLSVRVVAPELPPKAEGTEATGAAIDGTTEAFERDHPDATDLFMAGDGGSYDEGEAAPGDPDDDGRDDGDGSAPDAEPEPDALVAAQTEPKARGRRRGAGVAS